MDIRFTNEGPLLGELLEDVQQINVLCGKNSSGKSTALRAILDRQVELVFPLADFLPQDPGSYVFPMVTGFYAGHVQNVQSQVANLLRSLRNSQKIADRKVLRELSTEMEGIVRSQPQGSVQFAPAQLMEYILQRVPTQPAAAMLEAKRMLADEANFSANPGPDSRGGGVLEHLFQVKSDLSKPLMNEKYLDLQRAFFQATEGFEFEVSLAGNVLRLLFSFKGSELQWANEFGLGLKDILLILYSVIVQDSAWILIEEPENHLHPSLLRNTLSFLQESGKRVFLASHSNVALDPTYVDRIYQCAFENRRIKVSNQESRWNLLSHLGYSTVDNLVSDTLLLVEGPGDLAAMSEFLAKMPERRNQVSIWCLGGDIMDQQNLESLAGSFRLFVLLDRESEPSSQKIRKKVIAECERLQVEHHQLDRYAIENYYSLDAYRKIFPYEEIDLEDLDPNMKVEKQLDFNPKKQTRQLARETTLEFLKGTDLLAVLESLA